MLRINEYLLFGHKVIWNIEELSLYKMKEESILVTSFLFQVLCLTQHSHSTLSFTSLPVLYFWPASFQVESSTFNEKGNSRNDHIRIINNEKDLSCLGLEFWSKICDIFKIYSEIFQYLTAFTPKKILLIKWQVLYCFPTYSLIDVLRIWWYSIKSLYMKSLFMKSQHFPIK